MSINTILQAPKAIGSIPAAVKHYNDALSLSSDKTILYRQLFLFFFKCN